MPIEQIHTYLVHPSRQSEDAHQIGGTPVNLSGKLFELLNNIYIKSDKECEIDISFNRSADGKQRNECRDIILEYLGGPTLARGRRIAERLERVTDQRSGLGLLFLILGKENLRHKIVISRFPADSAILAEEDKRNLSVEFLERVFMKSATAYKAAMYQDTSLQSGFWLGQAVDRQINNSVTQLSNYWISQFLDSDFRTTAAAGTRRLAIALRNAAKKVTDVAVKSEIAAAVTLARSLTGKRITIRDFEEQFGLSEIARQAIVDEIKAPGLVDERFQFDFEEFTAQVAYRSVELDTGGMLTAESSQFDQVFHREMLDTTKEKVRFSTEGRIVSEKLGRAK
jgi:hypothetical protein